MGSRSDQRTASKGNEHEVRIRDGSCVMHETDSPGLFPELMARPSLGFPGDRPDAPVRKQRRSCLVSHTSHCRFDSSSSFARHGRYEAPTLRVRALRLCWRGFLDPAIHPCATLIFVGGYGLCIFLFCFYFVYVYGVVSPLHSHSALTPSARMVCRGKAAVHAIS